MKNGEKNSGPRRKRGCGRDGKEGWPGAGEITYCKAAERDRGGRREGAMGREGRQAVNAFEFALAALFGILAIYELDRLVAALREVRDELIAARKDISHELTGMNLCLEAIRIDADAIENQMGEVAESAKAGREVI